jgi:hypothetical protein
MTLKILGWIALIIGTGVNIFNLFAIIFVGAHYIEELTNGDEKLIGFSLVENLNFLCLVFSVAAIVIAWFNRKRGGFLVTIFAVLLIISSDPTVKEMIWQPFVLFIVGLILLYEVYYSARLSKKEETQ